MDPSRKSHFSVVAIAFCCALFTGCLNPYRANFNSTRDRFPSRSDVSHMKKRTEVKPKLVFTEQIEADNLEQFERGYVMIGFSKFDGPLANYDQALAQAKSVGAGLVLIQKRYTRSLTETVTVTEWPATETTEVRENSHITGSRGTEHVDSRVEVRTTRGPETYYVPKQVDYYEQSATYWKKISTPLFGALVRDLPEELKQKLETNRGLVVRAIMSGSPAYKADLLRGDVIIRVDGQPVPAAREFYELLVSKAGKDVTLTVLRKDKTMERPLKLNP